MQPLQTPTTPPIPQQRPQVVFSSEVYHRPVLSLPPVVLMGGENNLYVTSRNRNSCDPSLHMVSMPSPIVEMPPSPATNTLMYVEFPDDEVDDIKFINSHSVFEVRIDFHNFLSYVFHWFFLVALTEFSNFPFSCFFLLLSVRQTFIFTNKLFILFYFLHWWTV